MVATHTFTCISALSHMHYMPMFSGEGFTGENRVQRKAEGLRSSFARRNLKGREHDTRFAGVIVQWTENNNYLFQIQLNASPSQADTLFTLILIVPFKQKARKKNDGSSCSVLTKKDLASRYKAPFPIYTTKEGERFKHLTESSFTGKSSFNARNAGNKWIKDESILYLCYALFGRVEAPKVQTKDLFLLESVLQGKTVEIIGLMFDTLYNTSRHHGNITLGISSMAPILTYAAQMPIPPYRAQPTDTFKYMDGAFLKKLDS
ncbi:hypothetical protein JCGZ_00063 [Jatropha curcas]|uniref:Uncharacterized protein n=1 Tax=Jatropha curcas TaxID=180498 RepID=A0A067JIV1_JATCU|nr:hypothetical protein JCGZ_00063 [Jatropha curcas]